MTMMSMSAWHKEHARELEEFISWWTASWAKDPVKFPLEMSPGDWDEQFHLWQTEKEQHSLKSH